MWVWRRSLSASAMPSGKVIHAEVRVAACVRGA
jgi:hypothetical protein